jgi:murein DD-endopeptidase MepM/ murein hydrolase activator NlpD
MPRITVSFSVATLAIWLTLALPAGAWSFPERPAGTDASPSGGLLGPIRGSPPQRETAPGGAAVPASSGAFSSSSPASAPHKALAGSVRLETPLPWPRLTLALPFTEAYRQSPEFTYLYGSRGDGRYVLHTGVDIANPLGTPVRAVADGQVVYAGNDSIQVFGPKTGFYGNLLITRLDVAAETEPVYVLFGHLDRILVAQGARVSAGDVVGMVGMTGIAIGPHLHLEIRQGDSSYQATRNPALWLKSLPARGTLAGRIVDEAGRPVAGERLLVYRAEHPGWVWRVVRSYEDSPLIHGDDFAGENFALPDMPAGEYRIVAGRAGSSIQIPVRIEPGRLTLVEIRVQGSQ